MCPTLVLASASPRRSALLRAAGYVFTVRPSRATEWPYRGGDPAAYAEALAAAKTGEARDGEVVVGADTIVVLDGAVLGKPDDNAAAEAMLRLLSGRAHDVVTAVAVRHGADVTRGHARTRVTFRELAEAEIRAYVDSGEPMDKAGAYAYQGRAGAFVTDLDGDTDTVVGLPLALLRRLLPAELRGAGGTAPSPPGQL